MGLGGKRLALAALLPEMTRFPSCTMMGGAPLSVWTVAENLAPAGIRSSDIDRCTGTLFYLTTFTDLFVASVKL